MFGKRFEKMKKLPRLTLKLWHLGKFLLLLGFGALLAAYFSQYDWQFWGWVLVVAGLLLKLPVLFKLLWK